MYGKWQMKLFNHLKNKVRRDVPLADYTWFGIGGPAKYFIRPETHEELRSVIELCRENEIPTYVLGCGANLLIADSGVDGAVISLQQGEFEQMKFDADGKAHVGAGAEMGKLVIQCVKNGMSGLESLTGIPGTIGGCIRMNAGGAFGDIGSTIETVTVMNNDGEIFKRHKNDLVFGYRSTNITSPVILGATFALEEDDPQRILRETKQIWIYKKNSQPLAKRNAGCIFKNPRGMSAGALIDKAGMKGKKVGGAFVSDKHANFIIAEEGATAYDVLRLIDMIRDAVASEFNVLLEKEIQVW